MKNRGNGFKIVALVLVIVAFLCFGAFFVYISLNKKEEVKPEENYEVIIKGNGLSKFDFGDYKDTINACYDNKKAECLVGNILNVNVILKNIQIFSSNVDGSDKEYFFDVYFIDTMVVTGIVFDTIWYMELDEGYIFLRYDGGLSSSQSYPYIYASVEKKLMNFDSKLYAFDNNKETGYVSINYVKELNIFTLEQKRWYEIDDTAANLCGKYKDEDIVYSTRTFKYLGKGKFDKDTLSITKTLSEEIGKSCNE